MSRHIPTRVTVESTPVKTVANRRICCAVISLAAIFAGSAPAWADPIQAPGVAAANDPLIVLVDQAITITRQRNLDFQVHSPWQILHGLLALRNNYTIKNGSEFVNALDYISTSAKFKGDRWFERTKVGARAHPYNGTPYDFEGHVNQTLAILSMCDLPLTHQFVLADGSKVTMADMVRHAQWAVSTREETTWTLWMLTHYIDQDAQWTNGEGEHWSMEKLVKIQTAASLHNAPCGGCHGLFALAYARNAYLQKHGKLQGAWMEADQKLQQHITASQTMMNRDGSFATQFFKARGYSANFNERIVSSGHMLEWLMVALPRKRLDEQWVRLGVQTLANDLIRNAAQPADCGPLYHALHALILYKQRIDPTSNPTLPPQQVAQQSVTTPPGALLKMSTPDGESRPHSAQVQKEMSANAAKALGQPQVTASVTPNTVTPGTPVTPPATVATSQATGTPEGSVKTGTEDQQFKAPLTAEMPQKVATQEAPKSLQPAPTTQPPALMVPPTAPTPTLKPLQVAEDPGTLKKLSGEEEQPATKTLETVDISHVDPQELAPVLGGMPILKAPLPKADKKPAEGEEKGKTESEKGESTPPKLTVPESTSTEKPAEEPSKTEAASTQKPAEPAKTSAEKGAVATPEKISPAPNAKEIESKVQEAQTAAQAVSQQKK